MKIDFPPDLPIPGISLRQLERADLSDWFAYLTIYEVVEHTSWAVSSLDDLHRLLEGYESTAPTSPLRLAIVDTELRALIGTVGFHTVSDVNRSAEIAYDLAPNYWGCGIATAVCLAVMKWSFDSFGFNRVQATTLETNVRSERVLQKCLFRYEGLLRAYRMVRGRPGNFKMYARLATD